MMVMEFDMATTLSKSEQVTKSLWELISREKLRTGDQLPTEDTLANNLNVSRVTVRKAMDNLMTKGMLIRIKGKGTFLSEKFQMSDVVEQQSRGETRQFTVGIVVPVLTDDYFRLMAIACEKELAANRIKTIFWSSIDAAEVWRQLKNLQRNLDGLIINPPDTDFQNKLQQDFAHLPTVFGNESSNGEIDAVTSDDHDGAFQSIKYLYSLGHRQIVHIHGPLNTVTGRLRREGYQDAMRDCGLTSNIREADSTYSLDSGYVAMKKLLANSPIDAVFCANDNCAEGAYSAIRDAGLSIPDDISIIGYGNLQSGLRLKPQLTSVEQHPALIGTIAAEIISKRFYNHAGSRRNILIPVSLVFRDSCAPARHKG